MRFGVEFSKPTDRTARGAIIRVTYRSGGGEYVHRIGFELILCEGDQDAHPECDFGVPEGYGWSW
jgi:hypothetical protein